MKWQPTPVFLPEESHGWRRLTVYSPWGCKELDTTEWLHFTSLHEGPAVWTPSFCPNYARARKWAIYGSDSTAKLLSCFSHVRLFATPWTVVRLLCPWDSPGKNTGVGCHFILQGIFPTQGSNLGLLHFRQIFFFKPTESLGNSWNYMRHNSHCQALRIWRWIYSRRVWRSI